ncbi:polyamine ABC transporter substrate-binding protein [Leptolyngbya ohadii]|uniref:polyamine ABC transporter substrate-binding protein n=1 Tax=Leptolyngbya ohadii TaxID=1962290 RepID=UPI000B59F9FD|nr:spermidine/putrescine ABC transporter substrate-binding protein [Leptolyngbya ohadii]
MPPTHSQPPHPDGRSFAGSSRRRFLQTLTAAASSVVLTNCARNLSNPSATNSPTAASPSPSANDKTLYVYTWANYTDDELLKSFEAKTGIRTVVDTFDSNESMLAKVEAGGANAYSVIYPSDYMVVEMLDKGLLTQLDRSRLAGLSNLNSKWSNPSYDSNNAHSVPATWGTTGLIYNPERLNGKTITDWNFLWQNKGSLGRQVTLINDVREVMGATLRSLGFSYNSKDPKQIEQAYRRLVELKPAIASFLTNGWEDQLASGDLSVSMAYSSDAITLIEEKPDLKYVIPRSGTSIWTDTMVIPKSAPNPEAAYAWMNFMLDPANAAGLVERLNFATPNKAAFEKLPTNYKNNTNLYPPEAILAKCESIVPVPTETADLYDNFWTRLTSA